MREGLCIIKKATISGLFIRRGSKHPEIKAASQHFTAFFHEDMLQCTAKANACFDTLWLHLITQQFSSVCAFIRCSCRCRKCQQISVKKQACWPPWKVTRMHWVDISGPRTAAAAQSSRVKRTVQDHGELQYACGAGRRQFRTRDSYRAHGAFEADVLWTRLVDSGWALLPAPNTECCVVLLYWYLRWHRVTQDWRRFLDHLNYTFSTGGPRVQSSTLTT